VKPPSSGSSSASFLDPRGLDFLFELPLPLPPFSFTPLVGRIQTGCLSFPLQVPTVLTPPPLFSLADSPPHRPRSFLSVVQLQVFFFFSVAPVSVFLRGHETLPPLSLPFAEAPCPPKRLCFVFCRHDFFVVFSIIRPGAFVFRGHVGF